MSSVADRNRSSSFVEDKNDLSLIQPPKTTNGDENVTEVIVINHRHLEQVIKSTAFHTELPTMFILYLYKIMGLIILHCRCQQSVTVVQRKWWWFPFFIIYSPHHHQTHNQSPTVSIVQRFGIIIMMIIIIPTIISIIISNHRLNKKMNLQIIASLSVLIKQQIGNLGWLYWKQRNMIYTNVKNHYSNTLADYVKIHHEVCLGHSLMM